MYEFCVKPDEKSVLIELRNVHKATGAKFEAGIEVLTKALGYDSERQQKEISPFKAVRDLERISKGRIEEGLLKLWDAINRTWINVEKAKGTATFVLNNRIFLNPKTGKPLTNAEWVIIKKDVLKAFDYLYATEEERIAAHAMSLGRVLKGLSLDNSLSYGYKTLKDRVDAAMAQLYNPEWRNALTFAKQEAGVMIVELKQRQYKQIHSVIQNGIKLRQTPGQLIENLYDQFGDWNRDWRRIAETEIGNAQNNGQLLTELERKKPDEEYIFMKGISSSEACPWCRNNVDGQIVVLLEEPPDSGGDVMTIGGETYTVIWPGKSNYGRSRRDWWVAAGTQHPHCLIPGQEVTAALVDSVTEGFYKGNVIEITTRSGRTLTVTENHPILTPNGFLAAKFLSEGNYVMSSSNPERIMASINPNYYQCPTAIENLFSTAKHSSGVPTVTMPVTPKDFHGDGRYLNPNVNIVDAYGLLGNDLETMIHDLGGKNPFDRIDLRGDLAIQGAAFKRASQSSTSLPSAMSGLSEFAASLSWGGSHTNEHSFGSVAWDDVSFEKSLAEGRASHSKFSSEFLLRFAGIITPNGVSAEIGMDGNPLPFLITDEIVHIRILSYSGKVYDLSEVMYELYIGNGIVVKNCRCTWVKHIPGFEKWDEKFRVAMNQAKAEGARRQKIPNDYESTLKPTPWN